MAKGPAVAVDRPRNDYWVDLRYLAELVSAEFGVRRSQLSGKGGHRQVMDAKRFFCLFAHEVYGTTYDKLSHFLGLSNDGARMLALGLLGRKVFEHVDLWARVETVFKHYLTTVPVVVARNIDEGGSRE